MKVTLFTGAGASRAFGYPTTVEFMKDVDDRIKGIVPYDEVKAYFGNKGMVDVEMVLWELQDLKDEMERFREKDSFKKWIFYTGGRFNSGPANETYRNQLETLIKDIQKLVYERYWMETEKQPRIVYEGLFRSLDEPLDIFTTNYDLTIENSFWANPNHIDEFTDGFGFDNIEVSWNPSNYDRAKYRLYKLHGSLSWKRGGADKVIRIPRQDWTGHQDHIMLYPGFKGRPGQEPFVTLHKELSRSLGEADFCIVIGFSFRDEYINSLFKAAAETNKKMRLIIWNPDNVYQPIPKERVVPFKKRFGEVDASEVLALLK